MTLASSARTGAAAPTASLRLLDDVTLGQQIASALRARDPDEGRRLLGKYRIDLRAESDDLVDRFDATRLIDGRWVTVEMATTAVCADARARERFVATARAEQPLRHRCVLALLDTGVTPDGRPFVVREAIDSEPLAQLVARGDALSWKRIRSIAAQLVAAVTAARTCELEPREISLLACRRARHSRAVDEVKLVGLALAAEVGCDERDDVMAIADLVQQLAAASRELGVAIPLELDEVLTRAHADGEQALVSLPQLSRALAAIGQGATEWSRIPSTATAGTIETVYNIVRPADEPQDTVVEISCAPADLVEDRVGGQALHVGIPSDEPSAAVVPKRRRRAVLPWMLLVVAAAAGATHMLAPETWPRLAQVAQRGLEDVSRAVRGLSPSDVAASGSSIARSSVAPVTELGGELSAEPAFVRAADAQPVPETKIVAPRVVAPAPVIVATPLASPAVEPPPPPASTSKANRGHAGKRSRARPIATAPVVDEAAIVPAQPNVAESPAPVAPEAPATTARADIPSQTVYEANGPRGGAELELAVEVPAERAAALELPVIPEPTAVEP